MNTNNFHLLIGEMTITVDDVSCLLHSHINCRLLNHLPPMPKDEATEMGCYNLQTL